MQIQTAQSHPTDPVIFKVTLADGTILWVPDDNGNLDYIRLQAWVAAGGTVTS